MFKLSVAVPVMILALLNPGHAAAAASATAGTSGSASAAAFPGPDAALIGYTGYVGGNLHGQREYSAGLQNLGVEHGF